MNKKPLTLINVNGQSVHVSQPEKVLALSLKIQEKLENCREGNDLATELYDFTVDLSKQLRKHQSPKPYQNP